MPNYCNPVLLLASFALFFLFSCEARKIDQLRPETRDFIQGQEQARCICLDMYGDEMVSKINNGIVYIKGISTRYDLANLSTAQRHDIKMQLIPTTSMIKTVSACIAQRTPPIDELTGLLIREDLRVVLSLDSTLSDQEYLERMNQPSLEVLDDLCPQHQNAVLRLQDLIRTAQVLPPELQ